MSRHHLVFDYTFDCAPQALFDRLTDHQGFGELMGQNITRVHDGPPQTPNGLGAVRRIQVALGVSFDETVTAFEPPHRMAYRISRGSPIKDHRGELLISPTADGCRLVYRIDYAPKLPGTGTLLGWLMKRPIDGGLRRLKTEFAAR
jgi:uncharacterized protein YndB with AHSA1/START domain